MFSFLKTKKSFKFLAGLVMFFSLATFAYAQFGDVGGTLSGDGSSDTGDNPIRTSDIGELRGYAWMGTEINTPSRAEGGGGWLRFHCEPDDCDNLWGVHIDFDSTSESYGDLVGQAWSSNYGWLAFDYDLVQSCWESNTAETYNGPAKVILNDSSTKNPIVGWGKFVAGDDRNNDNWDGCVSFSGVEYSVLMNMETGDLEGWAWGGPIVGWISFVNPECPFCDTRVVLNDSVDIEFWADDYNIPVGGDSRLRWEAQNTMSNSVISCPEYGNTSNYNHWRDDAFILSFSNVGDININEGNLPYGEHAIENISQNTTYSLTCKDSEGNNLPTKYVTINVEPPVRGCMDPLALNYNPLANIPARCIYSGVVGCTNPLALNYNPNATVDDGSCILPGGDGGGGVRIDLSVSPEIFTIGSGNYLANPFQWTATSPSSIQSGSCVGSAIRSNNTGIQTINIPDWTGSVANPNSSISGGVDMTPFVLNMSPGSYFRFTLTCLDTNGSSVTDEDTIFMREADTPAVVSSLDLSITEPVNNGGPSVETIVSEGLPVELSWTGDEIEWDSCSGTSTQYDSNNSPVGSNSEWDGSIEYNGGPGGSMFVDMTAPNNRTTVYTLTCMGEDDVERQDSVVVCVDGRYCPSSGGGIPNYQEF